MKVATWSRVLQFRSGPESHRFYCCDEHRALLEKGTAGNDCFFATKSEPIRVEDPADEIDCDECREG